ncbi:MAG TPA: hypothetical protein VIH61_06465 [Waddliaceae bacterium]
MNTSTIHSISRNITDPFYRQFEKLSKTACSTQSFFREFIVPHHIRQPDLTWMKNCYAKREKMEPVIQLLLSTILKDLFCHTEEISKRSSQKVLEIGSGILNSDQQSYLSQFFVSFSNLSWTFSDVTAITKTYPKSSNHLSLNLLDKSSCKVNLFDRVIGCNVLDTLPYQDFHDVFAKIHSLLQPNQLFVHIADLNLYLTAFIDACIQDNYVLLPGKNQAGICKISKDQYNAILEAAEHQLSKEDFTFLQDWQKQSPQIQAAILNDALVDKWDLSSLIHKVQEVFGTSLQFISQVEMFENHLKSAAEKHKWRILKCEYVSGWVKTQQLDLPPSPSKNKPNVHVLDQGNLSSSFDETLPIGQEILSANIHVFIAAHP